MLNLCWTINCEKVYKFTTEWYVQHTFFFTHLNVLEVYKEYTTFPLFVRNSSAVNLSTFI